MPRAGAHGMIKTVALLKRRQSLSTEEFRAYYESTHRLIGEKYLGGHAVKYMRRYLNPASDAAAATFGPEGDFDVILEIWYPDRETYEAVAERLQAPEAAAEILADELKLFDRAKNRFFSLTEAESDLPS